ncbi:MAG: helix-turn-helix transcriptional regulator [Actinobacteria bacterium]|nr:helix-turn-helix transcriptional regulator [Actinomycetota bacterium]
MTSPSGRFAANLRKLRAEADLTQEELSFRAEVHRSQISLMESGERLPRLDTLLKLAGALGVGVGELTAEIAWTPGEHRPGAFVVGARKDGD